MAHNKIVFGDETLIDLTQDTVNAGSMLAGKTAHDMAGNIITGNIPNNGNVDVAISHKDTVYTIPNGYHGGGGSVYISSEEKNKIIAGNIKSGVSILGTTGTYIGDASSFKPNPKIVYFKPAMVDSSISIPVDFEPNTFMLVWYPPDDSLQGQQLSYPTVTQNDKDIVLSVKMKDGVVSARSTAKVFWTQYLSYISPGNVDISGYTTYSYNNGYITITVSGTFQPIPASSISEYRVSGPQFNYGYLLMYV